MDNQQSLEQKIDNLQATVDWLVRYTVERDSGDYDRDVSANLTADAIFEMIVNPRSFFDGRRG